MMKSTDLLVDEQEEQALDPRNDSSTERVVPKHPNPPARHEQDTQAVEGETAIDPPPGHKGNHRGDLQG